MVEANDAGELREKVEHLLDRGWAVQGGVSVVAVSNGEGPFRVWWYFQAMTRTS